jgi:hypothetical protein
MCAYGILRWCANTQPSAWLGGMQPPLARGSPPSHRRSIAAAASAHDLRVDTAAHRLARANLCTAEKLSLA